LQKKKKTVASPITRWLLRERREEKGERREEKGEGKINK
jgi:hypothetical protein